MSEGEKVYLPEQAIVSILNFELTKASQRHETEKSIASGRSVIQLEKAIEHTRYGEKTLALAYFLQQSISPRKDHYFYKSCVLSLVNRSPLEEFPGQETSWFLQEASPNDLLTNIFQGYFEFNKAKFAEKLNIYPLISPSNQEVFLEVTSKLNDITHPTHNFSRNILLVEALDYENLSEADIFYLLHFESLINPSNSELAVAKNRWRQNRVGAVNYLVDRIGLSSSRERITMADTYKSYLDSLVELPIFLRRNSQNSGHLYNEAISYSRQKCKSAAYAAMESSDTEVVEDLQYLALSQDLIEKVLILNQIKVDGPVLEDHIGKPIYESEEEAENKYEEAYVTLVSFS